MFITCCEPTLKFARTAETRTLSIGRLSLSLAALLSIVAVALSALVVTERLASWREASRQMVTTRPLPRWARR